MSVTFEGVIGPGLRETLGKYLPTWLGNVPGLRNLYSMLWTVALLGDCFREIAWEGQLAAYPGVGTDTALPYIAASRDLVQGPSEPNATFAARCLTWRTRAPLRGSAEGLATEIQAFLVGEGNLGAGVYPVVRVIQRNGEWVQANADQSVTRGILSSLAWTWDGLGGWIDGEGVHPATEVRGYWSDEWILIQDPYTHYTGFSDPNWLAAWGSSTATLDSLASQAAVIGIQSILTSWKGAHIFERCIVWVPDPTTFAPSGFYGNASLDVAGVQTAQRNPAYAYWQPPDGG